MATPEKKPFSPVSFVLDTVLTLAVFTLLYSVLQPHVQSTDPFMIRVWATAGAACITGVCWLAWQSVKVVYRFQRDSRK